MMVLSSCSENVLDKVPLDIISDNTVWNDASLADAYLTECYAETYVFMNVSTDNSWNNLWLGDAGFAPMNISEASDEAKSCWFGFSYKYGNLKITGGLFEWWEGAYKVIRKLNEFIEKVQLSPLDDGVKTQRIAEARFLRAYNYFELVKRYGGVPLITTVQQPSEPKESLYPARAKEQDVYDFVLSECSAIANDLPETGIDISRPTKYAVLALKCRAALYAGSIAQFGAVQLEGVVGINRTATDYYQQSFDAAKLIIDGGKYSLYNKYPEDKVKNFRNLFLEKNNTEGIFGKKHDTTNGMGNGGNGWAWDFFNCPYPNGWGGGNETGPYLEMAEEFDLINGSSGKLDRTAIQQGLWTTDQLWANKDPRFFASMYTANTEWKGSLLDYHKGIILPDGTLQTDGSFNGVLANGNQNINGTGFGVLKYLDESHGNLIGLNGDWATSSTDWMVFRYGEVLLNFAEAAFNIGKSSDALDAVNQIRNRAGIALLTSIDRETIRHERKVELAFEGHRYWDLRRWRTAVTDLSRSFSGLRYVLDYTTGKYKLMVIDNIDGTVTPPAFYPQNYYLPITLARTGNNTNLVENPGYN